MKQQRHNLMNHDIRNDASRRSGSVLILVMTLLSILFVIGVAFLATLNFEQDIIQAERLRFRNEYSVTEVFDDLTDQLRDGFMAGSHEPFGDSDPANSITGFAQLPMWHNIASPIEPYQRGIDGAIVYRWHTDIRALKKSTFDGPSLKVNGQFEINTTWPNGIEIPAAQVCDAGLNVDRKCERDTDCPGGNCVIRLLTQCIGGTNDGDFCDALDPLACPGGECRGHVVVDADGDGIVDTVQASAVSLGFSKTQVERLSSAVNGRPDGQVNIGLRIVPHSGLVNLNESHPKLIQTVFNLQSWPQQGDSPDLELSMFRHAPTQAQDDEVAYYSSVIEDAVLRRRGGGLPPARIPPSQLFGNRLLEDPTEAEASADMLSFLLGPGESHNDHRYWMYDPGETIGGGPDAPNAWAMRMEFFYSLANDDTFTEYDRSHLVTTISYDDLLSRGGRVETAAGNKEIAQAMRNANLTVFDPIEDPNCQNLLPFEYANYPQTIQNDNGCCPADEKCKLKRRKGRLQLSLNWLDEQFSPEVLTNNPDVAVFRNRIIYDVFWMLVRNASGPYWDNPNENNCNFDNQCGPGPFVCQLPAGAVSGGTCIDPWTKQSRKQALVSRTAASLTANLIDYYDADDIPTRIAIRSFDFSDLDTAGGEMGTGSGICSGGTNPGINCKLDTDCTGGGFCDSRRYVYGLERQPFISEIAANSDGTVLDSWGVELFNPYDRTISGEYWIYEVDPTSSSGLAGAVKHKIIDPIEPDGPNGPFTAFVTGVKFTAGSKNNGTAYLWTGPDALKFDNGWIVYLVRKFQYEPGVTTEIIVDQSHVDFPAGYDITVAGPVNIMQRAVPDPGAVTSAPSDIWKVTVPALPASSILIESLGDWNTIPAPTLHPVELNPANTGLLSMFKEIRGSVALEPVAFPTTGSMLMLLRHANRSLLDYDLPAAIGTSSVKTLHNLAFTTWLNDVTTIVHPVSGPSIATIKESDLIDNGRMPVFDRPVLGSDKKFYAAHHEMHDDKDLVIPGSIKNLPWGQLVFDYFTALSLDHRGPYRTYTIEDRVGAPYARPRVDMEGLRVHGRIDINAAPIAVLEGLPMIPVELIPSSYRARTRLALGHVDPNAVNPLNPTANEIFPPDFEAGNLGSSMPVTPILAYREAREGFPTTDVVITGDYGQVNGVGRAWSDPRPMFRRGTGFLTVGELANIRIETGRTCNGGANNGVACNVEADCPGGVCESNNAIFRIDNGLVNPSQPAADDADFVSAIAQLAALGDWVTVRSDVYTIYGVVRGEIDTTIDPDALDIPTDNQKEDLEARTIRFQDTVDRLPTFLGEPTPVSLNERILGKYRDVENN